MARIPSVLQRSPDGRQPLQLVGIRHDEYVVDETVPDREADNELPAVGGQYENARLAVDRNDTGLRP